MPVDEIAGLVTGRSSDLFGPDIQAREKELQECLSGSRVMVIGGAGSIGQSTIHAMSAFRPRTIHVIDIDENALAELIRDLRSGWSDFAVKDFQTLPFDFGSPLMRRFLNDNKPYDYIFNFAAIKHVRSEKNVYSLLQMLETNLIKLARFLRWLTEKNSARRYFCVSTDKAANPVSLMGASKRLMEHLIFSGEFVPDSNLVINSARFANVAFSEGSLLSSFLKRMEKKQPLAVPIDTRRYFISLREAGQICLLAAVFAPHRFLFFPRLNPENDLIELQIVAELVLRYYGYEPHRYDKEQEARSHLEDDTKNGRYPLLLTPLDTTGEKPYEEFVGEGERSLEVGMPNLLGIKYSPTAKESLSAFLKKVTDLLDHPEIPVTKEELVQWIKSVIPKFLHVETGKSLDDRM